MGDSHARNTLKQTNLNSNCMLMNNNTKLLTVKQKWDEMGSHQKILFLWELELRPTYLPMVIEGLYLFLYLIYQVKKKTFPTGLEF